MNNIADWEYALTRKLLKTAQHFVALPGVPPLQNDLRQWPTGNPSWNAMQLTEMWDLAKGYRNQLVKGTRQLAQPFFPDMSAPQLEEVIRQGLHSRLSQFNPERVPVFFYQLSGPGGTQTEEDRKRITSGVKSWSANYPRTYGNGSFVAGIPSSFFEEPAGFAYSWSSLQTRPTLRNWWRPNHQAAIFMNNRWANQTLETLPHEYAHALNPSLRHPNYRADQLLGEAVGMRTLLELKRHEVDRRHVEPNSPLEAILTGHEFARHVAYSRWYMNKLLNQLNPKSELGVNSAHYAQQVLEPADPYVPPGNDPWWQTMDAQRQRTARHDLAARSFSLASDAEDLTKALTYVVAYDQLKRQVPDISKATYADLLTAMRDVRNNRETKPLFDLVYFGPSAPEEVYKAVSPILERNPELKKSPIVKELTRLLVKPELFRYIQEENQEKKPESAEQISGKSPETTKATPPQGQLASAADKIPGTK